MLFALLAPLAHAIEGQPGMALPGAAPLPRGEGFWGVGTLAGAVIRPPDYSSFYAPMAGFTTEWVRAPSDALAFNVNGALLPLLESVNLAAGARYNLLNLPAVHVAPFAAFIGSANFLAHDLVNGLMAGVAVEAGWYWLRVDASAPVWSTGFPLEDGFWLGAMEFGFTAQFTNQHEVRLGSAYLMPTATYRHSNDGWFAEVTVGYPIIAASGGIRY